MTAMREPLSEQKINEALGGLPGWSYERDRLTKTFTFKNFREAVSFMMRLAFEAEALNHHPEMTNVYNRVTVALNTHDAGNKVTELDLKLARAVEGFSWV
jgi:4a-hydroxytetrahydrobiopterin dehydratase